MDTVTIVGILLTFHFPITVRPTSTGLPDTTMTIGDIATTVTAEAHTTIEPNCTLNTEQNCTFTFPSKTPTTTAFSAATVTTVPQTTVTTLPNCSGTTESNSSSSTEPLNETATNVTGSATATNLMPTTTTATETVKPNCTDTTDSNPTVTMGPNTPATTEQNITDASTFTTTTPTTTTTTKGATTSNPLIFKYPSSDQYMYLSASVCIQFGDLNYNDSLKPDIIRDFIAQMGTLLRNLTGYAGFQVTRITVNPNTTSSRNKREVNEIIAIEYIVLLFGDTDLNQTIITMPESPSNISLLGVMVVVEWDSLSNAINRTKHALLSDVCSVFKDVERCTSGFNCLLGSDIIICNHVCHDAVKCGANGECYFDDIVKDTMCRCKEVGGRYYTGPDCSVEAYKLALPLEAVTGICAGLGGALLLVILVLAVRLIISRRNNGEQPDGSTSDREKATWERQKFDDQNPPVLQRNDFNVRHYRGSPDNLANPTYIFPYDGQSEEQYTEAGSSLSNLNFPVSKFVISRPILVLGRNGHY